MKKLIFDTKIMAVCQSACGSAGITANGLQIGDRFVKRWHCAVGQTAANVLLGDRYFLCGGIYEY